MFLLKTTLFEKARLARSFPYVLGPFRTEAFVPDRECTLAPASPVGVDELRRQIVAHASHAQLKSNLPRTLPSRSSLQYIILCES